MKKTNGICNIAIGITPYIVAIITCLLNGASQFIGLFAAITIGSLVLTLCFYNTKITFFTHLALTGISLIAVLIAGAFNLTISTVLKWEMASICILAIIGIFAIIIVGYICYRYEK